jgi:PDZ domain-containing protein
MAVARTVIPETESARVTDTQPPTLQAPPRPVGASETRSETEREAADRVGLELPRRTHRFWAIPAGALGLLFLAAVAAAAVMPSQWFAEKENRRLGEMQPAPYALVPAAAEPVAERVSFSGLDGKATQYPPKHAFYFVTVMQPAQSVLSWLVGRDDPAVQFLTREDVFGYRSPTQRRTLDLEAMRTSEQVAQYVALKRLGFDAKIVLGKVLIRDMVCLVEAADPTDADGCQTWSPSDAVLDPGDTILEVDGTKVGTVEDLSAELAGRKPGDKLPLLIERPRADRTGVDQLTVEVELTSAPDEPDRTIVGFVPFDTATVDLPFEVSIDTQAVGGPSAGLAFTLTLVDELTEGELTGGRNIAVTGTIELDGKVGPIGGLRQKASAVAQTGVDVFLVPAAQGEDDIAAAQAVVGDSVELIPVATLDEALAVLERLGGDPIDVPAG